MAHTDPGGVSVSAARTHIAGRLRAAGVESPEAEALLLLEAATGLGRAELLTRSHELSAAETSRVEEWLARRERREPLQHILGSAHFYGLELSVSPAALVPRPETEGLVELALRRLAGRPSPALLDVGTGTGAIALAVKSELPATAAMATDVAPAALEVARGNAARLALEVDFALSDLLDAPEVRAFAARADVLASNPPYLPAGDRASASPEVLRDPDLALYAGEDGLDVFRRLERQARELLAPGAALLVELDPRNVRRALAESGGWAAGRVLPDLTGRPRYLELIR